MKLKDMVRHQCVALIIGFVSVSCDAKCLEHKFIVVNWGGGTNSCGSNKEGAPNGKV